MLLTVVNLVTKYTLVQFWETSNIEQFLICSWLSITLPSKLTTVMKKFIFHISICLGGGNAAIISQ